MKVLVTGHMGYVGNVLTRRLTEEKYEVVGCDVGFYPSEFINTKPLQIQSIKKDIRLLTVNDLKGFSAVIHLAALSNDPLGEINSSLTYDINYAATTRLANLAKEVGVEKFIYSSSCSTYGANNDIVDEESSLAPITAYAKTKVESEKELLKLKDEKFCPVNLRNATAYGVSPSMRLDIVVNNLTSCAFATGRIKLLSDGTSWRPLVHVEDMSNAFISVLRAPPEKVRGETFNIGSNDGNYTVRDIAEQVAEIIPNSIIEYAKEASKDPRSYRVNFDKIRNRIGYRTKWNLKDGIKEIYEVLKKREFIEKDFNDKKFYRVSYIKWLLEQKILDDSLFFKNS